MDNNKWTEDQQFSMGVVKIGGDAVKVEEKDVLVFVGVD